MSIAIIAQWVKTWNIIIKVPVVFKLKCKNQIPNLRVTRFSRRFVYIWTNIFNIFFLKIKRYLNKNQYFVCQILTSVIELNPPTHLHQFHTNLGKIQYVSESQQTQTSPKAFDPFLLFLKKKKNLILDLAHAVALLLPYWDPKEQFLKVLVILFSEIQHYNISNSIDINWISWHISIEINKQNSKWLEIKLWK